MALTLADTYYLKAMDSYPYDLEETIENLHYALSYNTEHANANCLMAKILTELFKDYASAEKYFEMALASDPNHLNACMDYAQLLIETAEYNKAEKLLTYARAIKGVDLAQLYYLEGLLYEYQKDYIKAIQLYKEALENAYDADFIYFIEDCTERVNKKIASSNAINYTT